MSGWLHAAMGAALQRSAYHVSLERRSLEDPASAVRIAHWTVSMLKRKPLEIFIKAPVAVDRRVDGWQTGIATGGQRVVDIS